MAMLSYQASHEQFSPGHLLKLAVMAEQYGFDAVNSSDHFHPWSTAQGHSGFSFAWLGAAMQATRLPFGVVCAPGQRYHPAIVAQAAATLSEMFPDRFWMAIGSGEALNEKITGQQWPHKDYRNQRMLECVELMQRLFAGETVTYDGKIKMQDAKLYTLPAKQPLLVGAAVTKETAAWMGQWADGLLTTHETDGTLQEKISAFRENGGRGKPVYVKVQLSYAHDEQVALNGAWQQWKANIFSSDLLDALWKPEQFDAAAAFVKPEDVARKVLIHTDPGFFIEEIKKIAAMGVDNIILHNVNRDQETFIRDFGEKVLPHCR